jgi:predicted esterase
MRRCVVCTFLLAAACGESRAASPTTTPPPSATATPTATPISTSTSTSISTATSTANIEWAKSDWCIEGLVALDDETCVTVPASHDDSLLVYLHGILPPYPESAPKTRVQTIVKDAATRGNIIAMMPRGVKGIGPKNFETWYAWPTASNDYAKYARAMVADWATLRAKLESKLGIKFKRTYLAGSSSGAYFLAALAIHGHAQFDGFGAMSGGAAWPTPELQSLPPRPLYVGYGTQDSVGGMARTFATMMQGAGWPVRVAEHPFGHGAQGVYIDEALAFFRAKDPAAQP